MKKTTQNTPTLTIKNNGPEICIHQNIDGRLYAFYYQQFHGCWVRYKRRLVAKLH